MLFDQAARYGANAGMLNYWTGTRHINENQMTPRGRSLGPELARRESCGPKGGRMLGTRGRGFLPSTTKYDMCAKKRTHSS